MSDDNPFEAPETAYSESYEYPLGDREPAEFSLGGILGRCWELVLEQPIVIFGTLGIVFLVALVFAVPGGVLDFMAELATTEEEILMYSMGSLAIQITSMFVNLFFTLGSIRVFTEVASGNEAKISMVFGEGGRYLSGLGTNILLFLAVMAGICLLVVPGIIVALGLQFALYIVVHQGKGPIDAITTSWELTDGYKVTIFVLNVVFALGALFVMCVTLGFGMLLVMPILSVAQAVMYHSLLHLKADELALRA